MARSLPSRRFLAAGLAASLLVHLGLGMVAGVTPVRGGGSRPASEPIEMLLLAAAPEEPSPEQLRLGIDESDHESDAWLGFADATEHEAPESTVDQSAMTPAPAGGEPAAALAPSPPEPSAPAELDPAPPEPSEPPASPSAALPAAPATPEPLPEADPVEADAPPPAPVVLIPAIPAPIDPATPDPLLELAQETPPETPLGPVLLLPAPPPPGAESTPQERTSASSPEPSPPPAEPARPEQSTPDDAAPAQNPEPPGATPVPPGEGGDLFGEKSPSESSAASRRPPVEIRPGRVAAAEGLQITTVRPIFDITTIATANPRSPTVLIEFGKDGRVRRAAFLPGRSTGESRVDQPLLDAVYRWTARGEPLDALSEDPDDVVGITMRILLR